MGTRWQATISPELYLGYMLDPFTGMRKSAPLNAGTTYRSHSYSSTVLSSVKAPAIASMGIRGIPSWLLGFMCIGILMLKEIKDEMSIKVHALNAENYWVRIISISLFIAFIILTASFNGGAFIYFQF